MVPGTTSGFTRSRSRRRLRLTPSRTDSVPRRPGTMADAPVPASKTTKTPPLIAAAKARSLAAARVSDLLRQIRLSEVQGRPADELRQQLSQAVEAMQQ